MILKSTQKLQIVTSSTAPLDVWGSYIESPTPFAPADSVTPTPVNPTQITTATTTDVVAAPSSGYVRNVVELGGRNTHASTSNDITVQLNDSGGADPTMFQCTLLAGESFTIVNGVFYHYDTSGGIYGQQLPVASDTVVGGIEVAVQSEMESASATDKAVTPGRQHYHPSANKCWLKAGLTGNILASYNIASLTDTGTGVLTVTIDVDFSSSDWAAIATIGLASTTVAQSCTYDSQAAGSIVLRSVVEAGSSADPVSWSFQGAGDQA